MFVSTACIAVLMCSRWGVSSETRWLVLGLRVVLGFASVNFISNQVFTAFVAPGQRPLLNVRLFVACLAGLSCGPIFSAVAHWLLDEVLPYFAVVPVCLCTLQGMMVVAMLLWFPDL